MEILDGEAEGREFVHCPAVILVTALTFTEIKVTNGGGMLLNTGELCHIRRSLLMAHIYAISVFLFEDPMHIIGVLFTAVVRLSLPHFNFVL